MPGILDYTFILPAFLLVLFPFWFFWERKRAKKEGRETYGIGCFMLYFLCTLIFLAVSIPMFIPRGCHGAKQCEAKTELSLIFEAQNSYFSDHHSYADNFTTLNWEPEGESLYAYSCGTDFIPNTKGTPVTESALVGLSQISATGFTCAAVGNIDNDPDLDFWIINDAKTIQNLPSSDL